MGAITVSTTRRSVMGSSKVAMGTITMSAAYATGGDTWTDANFGMGIVDLLVVSPRSGHALRVDMPNKKVKAMGQQPTSVAVGVVALDEIAAATNLSAVIADFIAYGVG